MVCYVLSNSVVHMSDHHSVSSLFRIRSIGDLGFENTFHA